MKPTDPTPTTKVEPHILRRLQLADFLETLPDSQFNMDTVLQRHECGTQGCIAGWAIHLFAPDSREHALRWCDRHDGEFDWSTLARDLLGLEATNLFTKFDLTRTDAIVILRDMAHRRLSEPDYSVLVPPASPRYT